MVSLTFMFRYYKPTIPRSLRLKEKERERKKKEKEVSREENVLNITGTCTVVHDSNDTGLKFCCSDETLDDSGNIVALAKQESISQAENEETNTSLTTRI